MGEGEKYGDAEHKRSVRAGGKPGWRLSTSEEVGGSEQREPAARHRKRHPPHRVLNAAFLQGKNVTHLFSRSPQSRRHSPLGPDEEEEVKEGRVLRAKVALMCCVQEEMKQQRGRRRVTDERREGSQNRPMSPLYLPASCDTQIEATREVR